MSSLFNQQPLSRSLKASRVGTGLPRNAECIVAFTALVLLAPFLIACAALVFLSSPGPVFFRQRRIGRYGEVFYLFKFRTMFVSTNGPLITAASDSRITPIGRFLRQWKLDELPELYNVLKGDMSFVGPRPEVPKYVDLSNPVWEQVLSVRPGITDPVTLTLRNEEAVLAMAEDKEHFYREVIQPYKMRGYVDYLETKSIRTDLNVILRTINVLLAIRSEPQMLEVADPYLLD